MLGVDGGNSKTDVVLAGADGAVLGAVRGPSSSHQTVGLRKGMETLRRLVERAMTEAGFGGPEARAAVGAFCLAGADLPVDGRLLSRAIARLGIVDRLIVRNDAFAGLRAGAESGWGVSVVCGMGVNGVGVGPTGRMVRFAALGDISGDWGGGGGLGLAALGGAVRGRDGRGPRTELETLVPAHFGLLRPSALVEAVYTGRIPEHRLGELAPVVFAAAKGGDPVGRALVDRQADEVVLMAVAMIRRLGVARRPVEVVLTGGIFRSDDPRFHDRIRAGIVAAAGAAQIRRLTAPPVLGAALLGLDALGAGADAGARIRAELSVERIARVTLQEHLGAAAAPSG